MDDKNKTPPPKPLNPPVPLIDALRLYEMMRETNQTTVDGLQALSARLVQVQKDVIDMRDKVSTMNTDLAETRVSRLHQEITDGEKERQILEERIRIVDAKLEEKKTATVGAVNTTDRIKQAAAMTYEERERIEQDARDARWAKRKESIVTAVLVTTSVGFVGGVLSAIGWFIVFYLQNR